MSRRVTLPRWLLFSGFWLVPGLLGTWQVYLLYSGTTEALTIGQAFLWRFWPWQIWAVATPLILALRRRFPVERGRLLRSVPVHLLFNAVLAVADTSLDFFLGRLSGQKFFLAYEASEVLPSMILKGIFLEFFIYWGVISVDYALEYQRRYRQATLAQAQLEARLIEAQLDALRMQLQPHFLFNTLNAISVLMRKGDAASAIKMLHGLSELLRRTLASIRVQFVPLRQELDFLQRYLDIETTRFPDRLRVVVDVGTLALRARIPNLILQPLVENAIKHGLAPRAAGGQIEIVARVEGESGLGGRLRVEIRDDGVGLREGASFSDGVGLVHVRERLAQLYPDRHLFSLEARQPSGAVASIEIPLVLEESS